MELRPVHQVLLRAIIDIVFPKTCRAPRSYIAHSRSLSYQEKQPRFSGHECNTSNATGREQGVGVVERGGDVELPS